MGTDLASAIREQIKAASETTYRYGVVSTINQTMGTVRVDIGGGNLVGPIPWLAPWRPTIGAPGVCWTLGLSWVFMPLAASNLTPAPSVNMLCLVNPGISTWTPSRGLTGVKITVVGGGGAGGGRSGLASTNSAGAGGGGGGVATTMLTPSQLAAIKPVSGSFDLSVGAGGVPQSGLGGSAGGMSSVQGICTASGGGGGGVVNATTSGMSLAGGAGGTASFSAGNGYAFAGQVGGRAQAGPTSAVNYAAVQAGAGGSVPGWGVGGLAAPLGSSGISMPGYGPGAGGSGITGLSASAAAGAVGRSGIVIIEEQL